MNHCTSGRDIDIGPFGITVMMRTGPRFSFSTNSGALQSFMFFARGNMYSPGFSPNGRIASCSRSASGRCRQLAAVPERRHVDDRARDEHDHR